MRQLAFIWNFRLQREKQAIRDTIVRELQAHAPHPLPDYTRAVWPPEVRGKGS